MSSAIERPFDATSLVGLIFDDPDYRDRFSVDIDPGRYDCVDQVVNDWFTKQPTLIRLISTNTTSLDGVASAAASGGYAVGSNIGSWVVLQRSADEIVFGDNMGFMEYLFSLRLNVGESRIEGSTAVNYLWRRVGKYYFALVKPVHRMFIKRCLRNTASPT